MKRAVLNFITVVGFLYIGGLINGQNCCFENETTVGIKNEYCRIAFDRSTGGLANLVNLTLQDDYLKGGDQDKGMPFRIYRDFSKAYEFKDDASLISRAILRPADFKLTNICKDDGLALTYQGHGLELVLGVRFSPGRGHSEWSLQVKNIKERPQELMVSFPCFEGVSLGPDGRTNMQTRSNGDSTVCRAWEPNYKPWEHDYYLNMHWHALWDPPSRNVFGLIFKDPNALPKKLLLKDKDIELFYFPPTKLMPGDSLELPKAQVLVYQGSWRATARAYRRWFSKAIPSVKPPAWFIDSDCWAGYHFSHGSSSTGQSQGFVMENFRDLAKTNIQVPFDNSEFAFYCQGTQDYGVHTDGDNIVRKDMGGVAALRDGIAEVHRLGLHTTLYIEGFIVYDQSELIQSGDAKSWRIMHKDGTYDGPYTKQNFHHMCPGAKGWQDHLARTAARLMRETGADGIRLDSLGYGYWQCYNPDHHHQSPFDYNQWMKELLSKVRQAVLEVNPDALLTTEAAMDWYGQWFHGALIQRYSREIPPIRLATDSYRPYVYSGGPVWSSLSGLAGGRSCLTFKMEPMEENWLCAGFPVHHTLVWGDVADDDPVASDPEIVTRCFQSKDRWAIIAARPDYQELEWPDYPGVGLSGKRGGYTLTVSDVPSPVKRAYLCDIETLQWSPLDFQQRDNTLQFNVKSNWTVTILTFDDDLTMVGFDLLPTLHSGQSTTMKLDYMSHKHDDPLLPLTVDIKAPGLTIFPSKTAVPATVTIAVPSDAQPGLYAIKVTGNNILGFKRFLTVE